MGLKQSTSGQFAETDQLGSFSFGFFPNWIVTSRVLYTLIVYLIVRRRLKQIKSKNVASMCVLSAETA